MKVKICINTFKYSLESWRRISKSLIKDNTSINYIILNHHFKQYRKNFKCTKHQLTSIIKKAKTLTKGNSEEFII